MNAVDMAYARRRTSGGACDGWHLRERDDLLVIDGRMPPGASGARHRHLRAHRFSDAPAGKALSERDGTGHRRCAGQGLHVPPGAAHRSRSTPTDARFPVVSSPKSHGDREDAPA